MQLHARSRHEIEHNPLPGPSAVICLADAPDLLAVIKDSENVIARLDLVFNDASEPFQLVRPPTLEHARQILEFVREHVPTLHLVIQCQVGIGRSQAVQAAIGRIHGYDTSAILRQGTYNRRLYRALLTAAGMPLDVQPLVSLAVRIKYAPDRLELFLLSMQRQRYENWEVVGVTDGPNEAAKSLVARFNDPRMRLIETEKPLGHWGHPYRQLALDACRGEFIGMSNDDNYYVPGYLEQMLAALENADVAMCDFLHSYTGWTVVAAGQDLGCWIARAALVRQVPWPGHEFTADRAYIKALTELAQGRVVTVERPLFVHN